MTQSICYKRCSDTIMSRELQLNNAFNMTFLKTSHSILREWSPIHCWVWTSWIWKECREIDSHPTFSSLRIKAMPQLWMPIWPQDLVYRHQQNFKVSHRLLTLAHWISTSQRRGSQCLSHHKRKITYYRTLIRTSTSQDPWPKPPHPTSDPEKRL